MRERLEDIHSAAPCSWFSQFRSRRRACRRRGTFGDHTSGRSLPGRGRRGWRLWSERPARRRRRVGSGGRRSPGRPVGSERPRARWQLGGGRRTRRAPPWRRWTDRRTSSAGRIGTCGTHRSRAKRFGCTCRGGPKAP